jgi:bla regulator protein blaR1
MKAIRISEKIILNNCKLVLTIDGTSSFSFLSYIFIPKAEYKSELHPAAILEHELCHVKQGHSIDIILAEVISILFWFNPTIYLVKRSICLNHEFLADQYVLKRNTDPIDYSLLLIKYVEAHAYNILVSSFNFSFIKKRFIMITKVQKKKTVLLHQLAIAPALILLFIIFGDTNKAQILSNQPIFQKEFMEIDASEEKNLVTEYLSIVKKASIDTDKFDLRKLTISDIKRLKEIYHKCSKSNQEILMKTRVLPRSYSFPKNGVTSESLQKWLKDDSFKIIIDMKLMNKSKLTNVKAEDFIGHHVGYWDGLKYSNKMFGVWLYSRTSFDMDNEVEVLPNIDELWPNLKK